MLQMLTTEINVSKVTGSASKLSSHVSYFQSTGKYNNCKINSAVKHYISIAALEVNAREVIQLSETSKSCLVKNVLK